MNGEVVTLPGVGLVAVAARGGLDVVARPVSSATGLGNGAARGLAAFGVATVLGLLLGDPESSAPDRDRSRDVGVPTRAIAAVVAGAVVLAATAAMVVPAGATAYEVVSAERDAPGPRVVAAGDTETANYTVANGGLVPIVSYLSTGDGVSIVDDGDGGDAVDEGVTVGPRDSRTVAVAITAPSETGLYRRTVTEHRYLAVLPSGLVGALYRLHPVAPVVAVDLLLGTIAYVGTATALGRARGRSRSRRRSPGAVARLRRWI
ncbi:hypothetical protein ACFQRB_19745 [Halobaculum litoreum]|uniref:Uncharacterized protein n=1 Tax=Halobaculum litoreum TaxID=3031998 RepID=A0ABD5XYD8_9EURY